MLGVLGETSGIEIGIDRLGRSAAEMIVEPEPIADPAAEQLIDGHAECLRLDVVQRLIDARQGAHRYEPTFPELLAVHPLP